MNDADLITAELVNKSKELWIVLSGHGNKEHGLFRDLDSAAAFIESSLAQRVPFTVELKHERSDDQSDLPLNSITSLDWRCPMRPMTSEEVRNHPNKQFTKDWLKLPPNVSDFPAAKAAGISFTGDELNSISIVRVSRYIGYIRRAGILNDKRKDVATLNSLYADLSK